MAELSVDELIEITGVSADEAKAIIMDARSHWFTEEGGECNTTVEQFALERSMPAERLLEQLRAAGVSKNSAADS